MTRVGDHPLGDKGRNNGIRNYQRVDLERDNDWNMYIYILFILIYYINMVLLYTVISKQFPNFLYYSYSCVTHVLWQM